STKPLIKRHEPNELPARSASKGMSLAGAAGWQRMLASKLPEHGTMTSINPSHDPTIPPPTPAGAAALKPSLQSGVACCLSGGGYRAMLFHVGSLWRFNEAGLLPQLKCFSA